MGCCMTKQTIIVKENQKQSEENKCNSDENNINDNNDKINIALEDSCVISPLTINKAPDQSIKTNKDNDSADIELELDCNLSKLNLKSDLDTEVYDVSMKEVEFIERDQSEHDLKRSKHFSQLGLACVKNNLILDNKKRIPSRATSPVPSSSPSTI